MTRPKHQFPRSKVRGRSDGVTLTASIPREIAHAMRLQPSDCLEWVWITEDLESSCKVRKVVAKDTLS